MLAKISLVASAAAYTLSLILSEIRHFLSAAINRQRAVWFKITPKDRSRNIVIVGASFAGLQAARVLVDSLPPDSPYRVVVVEPNSHFLFTWVLPRYCVTKGHEHKAFIPHDGITTTALEGSVGWIKDRVAHINEDTVRLQDSGEVIPYEHLVFATGSYSKNGLPSRLHETEKQDGIKRLQEMQKRIEKAERLVIVGGGAAGVELATDAKSLYPGKNVTLVHSRNALMHRFGSMLQESALKGAEALGCEVILEDRVIDHDLESKTATLKSGTIIQCDFLVNCVGQKPRSNLIAELSPSCISPTGQIKVKPSLQIDDDVISNIYACGDVADVKAPNPNARSAMRQATIVARNILQIIQGNAPCYTFKNHWADCIVKITLGLDRNVTHLGNGKSELLFESHEDEDGNAAKCWNRLGKKPFEDDYLKKDYEKHANVSSLG